MLCKLTSISPEDTMAMATRLAQYLHSGDVLTLAGDLGAGKTTFTKGLAKGLGIDDIVNSPTFTIIKEYSGHMPLYHMDVYRLEDEEDLGFEEYFSGEGVTVVEWANHIASYLPLHRLEIEITRDHDDVRNILIKPIGSRFEEVCKEFCKK